MENVFYTENQRKLAAEAHDFAVKYILPKANQYDENSTFPLDIFEEGRNTGIMLGMIPQKYGGRGLTTMDRFIIAEELSWACSGIAIAMQVQDASVIPILLSGSDEQKKFYFSEMLNGKNFAMAFTEPGAGSDLAAIKTVAEKCGDKYILTGKKTLIASVKYSDYVVVFARIPDENQKLYTMFVVDTHSKGFIKSQNFETLGQRANDIGEIILDHVEVPLECCLGVENGFGLALRTIEANRICCASVAIGIGKRAMEEAINYAMKRESFGKHIWKHQAVGHLLAKMDVKIKAAKMLSILGIRNLDEGEDTEKFCSYAKVFATDSAMQICTDALQILGGYGIMKCYPMEKLFRDVKCCQIYEGPSQIQYDIIIRHLIREKGKKLSQAGIGG